jgi:hypothetical protein
MPASIEESLIEKLRGLPLEKQQEVLEFVEKLDRQETRETSQAEPKDRMPIWDRIREISADVSDEEWAKLPTDGAEQHDHYLYGSPKKQRSDELFQVPGRVVKKNWSRERSGYSGKLTSRNDLHRARRLPFWL